MTEPLPFLRIPPFPGARIGTFVKDTDGGPENFDARVVAGLLRSLRVGGTYWGSQAPLPEPGYALVCDTERVRAKQLAGKNILASASGSDPWHLISGASEVVAEPGDDVALVAALAGVPVRTANGATLDLDELLRDRLAGCAFVDPFTGEAISLVEAIKLCGFWRRLIDSNRTISAAVGFAFWKRPTVAPLLWSGGEVPFASDLGSVKAGGRVAIWRSRCSPHVLAQLHSRSDLQVIEVEDGFIRSTGLGADCIPPLSIVADSSGIYFDPSQPSDLERLLQEEDFDEEAVARAQALRKAIVYSGLSKYETGQQSAARRVEGRRHILVPGQVEDDRSVLSGGSLAKTNLELLRRVREASPDAYILYKPHPDVEAGHRAGAVSEAEAALLADEIIRNEPISSLIAMVDEVHVNTSLAGFEALLRDKPVTTYGMPFYAGWGLTRDMANVPERRSRRRSLDELVAAALLAYPRYLDPKSGLPCPPEILIQRLSEPSAASRGFVVRLRQLQGKFRRKLSAMRLW